MPGLAELTGAGPVDPGRDSGPEARESPGRGSVTRCVRLSALPGDGLGDGLADVLGQVVQGKGWKRLLLSSEAKWSKTMTDEEFRKLLARHLEAENAHRLAGTLGTLAPDCLFEDVALGRRFDGLCSQARH